VFFAAPAGAAYTLEVSDAVTGVTRTWRRPAGGGGHDTAAF
jgi:hypothetical protein